MAPALQPCRRAGPGWGWALWKAPVPPRVSSSSSTDRRAAGAARSSRFASRGVLQLGRDVGRSVPRPGGTSPPPARSAWTNTPTTARAAAGGGQEPQAFKGRRRDLRSGFGTTSPQRITRAAKLERFKGGQGWGGHIIPDSITLCLHRQKGPRQRDGLKDKQIILSCLSEERQPLTCRAQDEG